VLQGTVSPFLLSLYTHYDLKAVSQVRSANGSKQTLAQELKSNAFKHQQDDLTADEGGSAGKATFWGGIWQ